MAAHLNTAVRSRDHAHANQATFDEAAVLLPQVTEPVLAGSVLAAEDLAAQDPIGNIEASDQVGLVQVFTSPNRTFLTDTLAQALRVAGQGRPVLVAQFLKGGLGQGHDQPLSLVQHLTWLRADLARREFPEGFTVAEGAAVLRLWQEVQTIVRSGAVDLIVLDELSDAIHLGAIDVADVIAWLADRPGHVDVLITGQNMPAALLEAADQVSEIRRDRRS